MVSHRSKNADVKILFEDNSRTHKTNYRPVRLLPVIYKVYERLICKQVFKYFEPILSKYQCRFKTGPSTQHSLLVMVEKWKICLDKKGICGALICLNF